MCDKIEKTDSGQARYYLVKKQPVNDQDLFMYIYMYTKTKITGSFLWLYIVICYFQTKILWRDA
jgi:hypothetical protein